MKRLFIVMLSAVALLAAWAGSAFAIPSNDNFTAAVSVSSLPFTHSVSTVGATTEAAESSPCGGMSATVWYTYTPSSSLTVDADTFGSNYDTVLAAYTGTSLPSLSLNGCNDDSVGVRSRLVLAVTGGTTYYFQIGGFFGATGDLTFNIDEFASPNTPTVAPVDIKPGGNPNSVNPSSGGVIPVAILTTDDFDAATVDPDTVRFAVGQAPPAHFAHALEDVDDDTDLDLMMHFWTEDTGIKDGDTQACVTGTTFTGHSFEGCDAVKTVPANTDSELDGFADEMEATIGTPQFIACEKSGVYLGWPPDVTGDRFVNFQDLNLIVPALFSVPPEASYDIRLDVHEPGTIVNFQDLNTVLPYLFMQCT